MKKSTILFFIICIVVNVNAQNTVVGKWKIAKLTFTDGSLIKIDKADIKRQMYSDKVKEKKDTALTYTDSVNVETAAGDLYNQFSTTRLEYKANKTYIGNFGGVLTTGTFVYNATKKQITTKPKNKPPKITSVLFENGMLVFEVKEEGMTMYLERVK